MVISHRTDDKDFEVFLTDVNRWEFFALKILFLSCDYSILPTLEE